MKSEFNEAAIAVTEFGNSPSARLASFVVAEIKTRSQTSSAHSSVCGGANVKKADHQRFA